MEIIGRRWTIAYALTGSLPGLALMLVSHRAGDYAGVGISSANRSDGCSRVDSCRF